MLGIISSWIWYSIPDSSALLLLFYNYNSPHGQKPNFAAMACLITLFTSDSGQRPLVTIVEVGLVPKVLGWDWDMQVKKQIEISKHKNHYLNGKFGFYQNSHTWVIKMNNVTINKRIGPLLAWVTWSQLPATRNTVSPGLFLPAEHQKSTNGELKKIIVEIGLKYLLLQLGEDGQVPCWFVTPLLGVQICFANWKDQGWICSFGAVGRDVKANFGLKSRIWLTLVCRNDRSLLILEWCSAHDPLITPFPVSQKTYLDEAS